MLDIRLDDTRLRLLLQALPAETAKAAKAAMRRTVQAASTEMLRGMKENSWLRAGELRGALLKPLFTDMAGGGIEAEIRVRGKGFGMDHYRVRPRRVTARKGKRSRLWTPPQWQTGPAGSWHSAPGTFMAVMKNGTKPLLMQRLALGAQHLTPGDSRAKEGRMLRRLYGPSPQYFAAFREVRARVARKAREVFPRRLEHEIMRQL